MDELTVYHLKNDGIKICLDHVVFVMNKSYADAFCDFVRQQKLKVSIKETFDADPKAQICVQYEQDLGFETATEQANDLKHRFVHHLSSQNENQNGTGRGSS